MNIYVSHSSDFDYEHGLYLPLESSAQLKQHVFFLPHRPEFLNVSVTKIFDDCDAVFAEVSFPSTGQGIELGRASEKGIPIICAHQMDKRYSSSLRFITTSIEAYRSTDELINVLAHNLGTLTAH